MKQLASGAQFTIILSQRRPRSTNITIAIGVTAKVLQDLSSARSTRVEEGYNLQIQQCLHRQTEACYQRLGEHWASWLARCLLRKLLEKLRYRKLRYRADTENNLLLRSYKVMDVCRLRCTYMHSAQYKPSPLHRSLIPEESEMVPL